MQTAEGKYVHFTANRHNVGAHLRIKWRNSAEKKKKVSKTQAVSDSSGLIYTRRLERETNIVGVTAHPLKLE